MGLQQRQSWEDQDGNVPVAWVPRLVSSWQDCREVCAGQMSVFPGSQERVGVEGKKERETLQCSAVRGSLSSLSLDPSPWMLGGCVQISSSNTHIQQVGSTETPAGE